jgi:hypothetical protein
MDKSTWIRALVNGAKGVDIQKQRYIYSFDRHSNIFQMYDSALDTDEAIDINSVEIPELSIIGEMLPVDVLEHTIKTWSETNYPDAPNEKGYMDSLNRLYPGRFDKVLAEYIINKTLNKK